MFCSKCGKELQEGSDFCTECGEGHQNVQFKQQSGNKIKKGWIIGIIIVAVIIGFIATNVFQKRGSGQPYINDGNRYTSDTDYSEKDTSIEKDELIGDWETTISYVDVMDLVLNSNSEPLQDMNSRAETIKKILNNINTNIEIHIYYCFEEDGCAYMIANKNEWASSMKRFALSMLDYMQNLQGDELYDFFAAINGATKEDVDKMFSSSSRTIEDYVAMMRPIYESMTEEQLAEDYFSAVPLEDYKDKNYFLLDTDTVYELTKKEIILNDKNDFSKQKKYPYTFENGKLSIKLKMFDDKDEYLTMIFQKTTLS